MIRRTKEYILENKMINNHSTVLVALSGGADSVCLLLVLNEIKRQCADELDFALEAVHVEHGIRGAESREDARFASDLCERLNIPCHVHSVDVPQYAKSHGLGLEEAARILRYEAFEREVATAYAADQKQGNSRQVVVAVAHHMEDNAETVLFQGSEGTIRHASGFREERCHLYQAAFISNTRTDRGISKGKRTGFCHRCHKHGHSLLQK